MDSASQNPGQRPIDDRRLRSGKKIHDGKKIKKKTQYEPDICICLQLLVVKHGDSRLDMLPFYVSLWDLVEHFGDLRKGSYSLPRLNQVVPLDSCRRPPAPCSYVGIKPLCTDTKCRIQKRRCSRRSDFR